MLSDEGYIKFNFKLTAQEISHDELFRKIIEARQILYQKKLLGAYQDGIGYGNLSLRLPGSNQFIISSSGSGNLEIVDKRHFVLIKDFNIDQNFVNAEGLNNPSSESLTHAACYLANSAISVVIHTHSAQIWNSKKNIWPTTGQSVPYGTPQMAYEVSRVIKNDQSLVEGRLVMAGHTDGVIFYADNLKNCLELALGSYV